MSFAAELISDYLEPKGFEFVAVRLKEGKSQLDIRNEIVEETGASKLVAGKLVESAMRAIKVASVNFWVGAALFVGAGLLLLFVSADLRIVFVCVTGAAQFVAGYKVKKKYKEAAYNGKVKKNIFPEKESEYDMLWEDEGF